jgi:hypothetical protein
MWISEEDGDIRLGSHRNLLNRVQRDSDYDDVSLNPVVPLAPEDCIDPAVLSKVQEAVRKPRRTTGPILTHSEAADAVIVGKLAGKDLAARLFQKQPEHIQSMSHRENQSHQVGDYAPTISQLIEEQRTKIRDMAFQRLETVLDCLDEQKIRKVDKARDLGSLGVQISTIAEKMLPKEMQSDNNVHFHMYRPEVKAESEYEKVEVGEEREPPKMIEGQVTEDGPSQ